MNARPWPIPAITLPASGNARDQTAAAAVTTMSPAVTIRRPLTPALREFNEWHPSWVSTEASISTNVTVPARARLDRPSSV